MPKLNRPSDPSRDDKFKALDISFRIKRCRIKNNSAWISDLGEGVSRLKIMLDAVLRFIRQKSIASRAISSNIDGYRI